MMYTEAFLKDKIYGVYFWGAIGDALGSPYEFMSPEEIAEKHSSRFEDLENYYHLQEEWTDDTAMALLLSESLLECGFNYRSQMEKYIQWEEFGYKSMHSFPKGIGIQTEEMIVRYLQAVDEEIDYRPREIDLSNQKKDSNGCLMRLGPVPLYYFDNKEKAIQASINSAKTTHNTDMCREINGRYGRLIRNAVHTSPLEISKEQLLKNEGALTPLDSVNTMLQSYKTKKAEEIKADGFILNSLEGVLWALQHGNTFAETLVEAIKLWRDTDTTACIVGYVAGGYYGFSQIPQKYLEGLAGKELILEQAERMLKHVKKLMKK